MIFFLLLVPPATALLPHPGGLDAILTGVPVSSPQCHPDSLSTPTVCLQAQIYDACPVECNETHYFTTTFYLSGDDKALISNTSYQQLGVVEGRSF